MFPSDSQSDEDRDRQQHPLQVPDKRLVCVCVWQKVNELAFSVSAESSLCPQDLSETDTTLVVPFVPCIEDGIESPPLTPLNVTVRVATHAWPEKLLQGGLGELQQVGHYHHRKIYDDIHC